MMIKLIMSALCLFGAWLGFSLAKECWECGDSLWEVCFCTIYGICGLAVIPIVIFIV